MPRSAELKGVWEYVTVAEAKPLTAASSRLVASTNAYRSNPNEDTRAECLKTEKEFFALWNDAMSKRGGHQEVQGDAEHDPRADRAGTLKD